MGDKVNVAVVWFDKGLQINKLRPHSVKSGGALAEAFKCYALGLGFSFGVLSLVFFLQTDAKLDAENIGGLSIFCLVQLVSTACFLSLFVLFLRLLRVRLSLRHVTVVCCYAFGGLFPLVSISTGYFVYSAIRLAKLHGDPGLPYLTAAIYSELRQPEVLSVRILVWLSLCVAVGAVIFYSAHIVRLLSRLGTPPSPVRIALSFVMASSVYILLLRNAFRSVFWLFIIKLAKLHAPTQ